MYFLSLVFLLFASVAFAAPASVSINSGTLSDGETVVITVTGHGSKSPAEPYFFDNFNSGSLGASANGANTSHTATTTQGAWVDSTNDTDAVYSSTHARHANQSPNYNGLEVLNTVDNTSFLDVLKSNGYTNVFISVHLRQDTGISGGTCQIKLFRVGYQVIAMSLIRCPGVHYTWRDGNSWLSGDIYRADPCNQIYKSNPDNSPSLDTWNHIKIELYDDPTNGYVRGELFKNGTRYVWDDYSGPMSDAGEPAWNLVMFGSDAENCSSGSTDIHWDDAYVDITPARVELRDSATYTSATASEIQIPTAWGAGSVTIEVNQGAFDTDEEVYVWVCDSNNDCAASSESYTIGGVAEPPPTAGVTISMNE